MTRYAASTTVTSDRSMAEIESTLMRYGADKFMYGRDQQRVPDQTEFAHTPTGRTRQDSGTVRQQYEQAVRARYRALLLVIKAKLESVESGIEEFEDAFMAQIVLPDGSTVGERMKPQIEHAYLSGKMPPLLPEPKGG